MKSLISLIKKEWHTYKFWWAILILLGFIFIGILPPFLENVQNTTSTKIRLYTIFISFFFLFFMPIIQLLSSIQRDIKQRDIWLHNPNSIFTLIGAKWLFTLFALILTSFTFFSGFYLLGNSINGSWWQIALLIALLTWVEIAFYITFSSFSLIFFSIYLQVKRYIGHFSIIIIFALSILFIWLLNKIPENFLSYGKLSTNWIQNNLPHIESSTFIDVGTEIYLVDILFSALLFVTCYIIACKWIEKVITR